MLYRLLSRLDQRVFQPVILSLVAKGRLRTKMGEAGYEVHSPGLEPGLPRPKALFRLIRLSRRLRPDLIQGWMFHGNAAAEAIRTFSQQRVPVLWNICHSLEDFQRESFQLRLLIRALKSLAGRPYRIIYSSRIAAKQFRRYGYKSEKPLVIPNGFDCSLFRPDFQARTSVRAELKLGNDTPLIGLVARYHPIKDHLTFLRAAAELTRSGSAAHFLLVGRGTDSSELDFWISKYELAGRVHALGERADVPRLTASLDIATNCSRSEAFPLAVGEAMACGVPSVVTAVGDSPYLVDGTGLVVPKQDHIALANACRQLLSMTPARRLELGRAARYRILANFSLDVVATRYEHVYAEALDPRRDQRTLV